MKTQWAERTTAEKTTMSISILVLVTICSLAVWAAIRSGDGPPIITVEPRLEEMRVENDMYYVPITIHNDGGRTARDVTVSGELTTTDGDVETVDVTIDFLAGGESEDAEMVFSESPQNGQLEINPASFVMP